METLAQENVVLSQNQPILPEQPKQNNFLVILLSVLLLLSVSIAGFFAYQTQTLVKELTLLKSSPTLVSSAEPTLDPTADWKTYTNAKYGFSFKYPKDSIIKTDTILTDGSIEFSNFIFILEKTDGTLIDYINRLKDTNGAIPTSKVVNKFETVEWIGSYKNAPTHYKSIFNNGLAFNFGITNINDVTQFVSAETVLLNQILSTFKLADQVDEGEEIKAIFEKVNKELNSKITIDEQSNFYDSALGQVNKKSWSMDLTHILFNNKSNINTVEEVLLGSGLTLDPTRSAGGSEASVDAFVGDNILCYLIIEPTKKKLNCAISN